MHGGRTAQVLLVSPDRLTREMIGGWLSLNGYRLFAGASTAEALAAVPGGTVRLAILDLEYSSETALGVVEKARRLLPGVSMIALTSCPADAEAITRGLHQGGVAALEKYGSLVSLRQAVEDCLTRH
jgi:DNA-binding response OmpR family regulator